MAPSDVAGPRVGAALLDLALYVAACAALFFAMAESTQGFVYLDSPQFHLNAGDTLYYVDGPAAQLYWLATLVLAFVQFGVLPGLTGWTPGKLVTGLRVRRPDGAPAGFGQNLVRAVLWIVDGFPYFIPGLVGFVMVLARSDRRRPRRRLRGSPKTDPRRLGRPARRLASRAATPRPRRR
jgi:uncharacterized RDD family membrane protein YckC